MSDAEKTDDNKVREVDRLFCLDCGDMLHPKKKDEKMLLYCGECDKYYVSKTDMKIMFKGESKDIRMTMDVSSKVAGYRCSRCGNDTAYVTIRAMDSADEPEVVFYRCGKCGNTDREGGEVKF
jgi:DNA-directed RNA polymerase subunit M/transcription elongation factor TFIIS